MKQWLSQMSLFLSLGHTVSEQCNKIPIFPLLEADNWCDKFHPGGHKDTGYWDPLLPIPVDFSKQPETQDLGGAAQHLEGLIIKKAL